MAYGCFRNVGIRKAGRSLRRTLHRHVHRTVPVHTDPNPRRHADFYHRPRHVGLPSRARRRGTSSALLGVRSRRQPRSRSVIEESNRRRFPRGRRVHLSFPHQTVFCAAHLAAAAAHQRILHRAFDCRTLAHPGDTPEPSALLARAPQWPGRIPWLPVVLLHQQATTSLPQSALSARLQYRPANLVLAFPFALAFSVERLFPSNRKTVLYASGPRGPNAPAGALLD